MAVWQIIKCVARGALGSCAWRYWVSWYSEYMPSTIGPEKAARIAAVWPMILEAIAGGARIDQTAAKHGLTRDDLRLYRVKDPTLAAAWDIAMADSADAYVDRMEDCMAEAETNAKGARVKANILQWIAEKRNPERYGQRTRADINVKTVDLTAIIRDANARLANAQQGRIIDVTPNNSGASGALTHALPELEHSILDAAGLL